MKIPCNIISDLMPLVKDGIASEESIKIVQEHMEECEKCKSDFQSFQDLALQDSQSRDMKIIFSIKRNIFITQISILIIGAIVGVALTNSMGMFYNFLIMPIIGGISFITFKTKWHRIPLTIFLLSYLWQIIDLSLSEGFMWGILYGGLFLSLIYGCLVVLGTIIAMLLKFAFKREEDIS
ncbi:zf-HC2 domain-containing protein [Irregularibacter muris]|uniref:Zf-HC2 domain-containing protein n=1 Tax=Irregularibacter muris TaxID=1796619 RepID=A0AAE3HE55_9FIRM|nr:zf-HC2 domain-containing protein [Irregularibacter muris]MCR1897544.1 zf-HC2 domain-containing protein [Irregularibacter muris]